ncbi:unnamed protein product [Lepeophtheirus salmonis]|uniref:(salmon louse) hypothetical protein n=1 Tax=Lepeophtheirus salmonis TaxID=72036 RepID=A0A7R8HDT0_LEPSM|nr:unnamed protein product [Lepeophtheirus salmonis]CAF3040864.1 unnamed protein product [Lepeophtheirus salmonis]
MSFLLERLIFKGSDVTLILKTTKKIQIYCAFDFHDYPFDTQTCTVEIGLSFHIQDTVAFLVDEDSITYDNIDHLQYDINDMQLKLESISSPLISSTFIPFPYAYPPVPLEHAHFLNCFWSPMWVPNFSGTLSSLMEQNYIMPNYTRDLTPLLGLKATEAMTLVKTNECQIERVSMVSITDKLSNVFDGLGTLQGQVSLNIGESVQPVISPSRRIPVPIQHKVKR